MYALIYLSFLWLSVWSQNILIISNFNLETSVTQNNSQFLHLHCLLELVDLSFTMLSTSQVISVASYSERGNCDKFGSEALFSDWGSFTCRKSTTRDPWLYFASEGSHTQDFPLWKNSTTPAGFEPANLGSSGEYDNHETTGVDTLPIRYIRKYCKMPYDHRSL